MIMLESIKPPGPPALLFLVQYRNQYDSDVSIWSPQGRIHQIEYAMEAVKQVNSLPLLLVCIVTFTFH